MKLISAIFIMVLITFNANAEFDKLCNHLKRNIYKTWNYYEQKENKLMTDKWVGQSGRANEAYEFISKMSTIYKDLKCN